MNLNIFTIVYNGMPWIRHHYPVFLQLPEWINWRWVIAEGAAANRNCTSWCKPQIPNSSVDGTLKYLSDLTHADPRIEAGQKVLWNGKLEMCNWCLGQFKERGVLLQVDADELWSSDAIAGIVDMFRCDHLITSARFYCRYFVGPDIITMGDNCYGNQADEWKRAWAFNPGDYFASHEPPRLVHQQLKAVDKVLTRAKGIAFDHMAYATRAQVAYKEQFYGYYGAVMNWERLQGNSTWPVRRLKDYLPWVDDQVGAERILLTPKEATQALIASK